ncbi:TniQ family protein [Nocardia sp. CA-135953]|uniref:TniQ family protein n=1 Tax=Nocardia sp. CA-135953 TaxID=3239978 RepID=UPI003D96D299
MRIRQPPLSLNLLLDLDTGAFAAATRLSTDEAATLTLVPLADRYPPIAKTLFGLSSQVDRWLFNNTQRYCPKCLTGDRSPIQQQHGGPWKLVWHLPISFACPHHQIFLRHCPQPHQPRDPWRLITNIAESTLHPAQCRYPLRTGRPANSVRPGRYSKTNNFDTATGLLEWTNYGHKPLGFFDASGSRMRSSRRGRLFNGRALCDLCQSFPGRRCDSD